MKFSLYLIILIVNTANLFSEITIADFYKKLDHAYSSKEARDVIDVLEASSQIGEWSFGAGLGPADREFLRYTAVYALYDVMGDSKNELSSVDDEWVNDILAACRISNVDYSAIGKLLSSHDSATRFMGLKKLSSANSKLPQQIVDRLQAILSADPFIIIARKSLVDADGVSISANIFSAPLREMSSEMLGMPYSDMPSAQLVRDGMSKLVNLVRKMPENARDINEAIFLLHPSDKDLLELQKKIKASNFVFDITLSERNK